MHNKIKSSYIDKLFEGILQLKSSEECYNFFEDLCTIHELQSLAQRLEVAQMLTNGDTYITIGQKTGASTATISRVNRALNYGSDGYKLVLNRLNKNKEKNNDYRNA